VRIWGPKKRGKQGKNHNGKVKKGYKNQQKKLKKKLCYQK
jgi:hypothetical protein